MQLAQTFGIPDRSVRNATSVAAVRTSATQKGGALCSAAGGGRRGREPLRRCHEGALSGEEPSAMPVVDGRRGFGAANQAIEVFENLVVGAVRAVCEEVCEQWRSLRETK